MSRDAARRTLRVVAALGAVATSVAVEFALDPQQVAVGGFALAPLGNLVHAQGRGELHPKALVGAGWNDNLYGTQRDQVADGNLRAIVGAQYRFQPIVDQIVIADAEIDHREQFNEDKQDLTGGTGSLQWLRKGPRLEASAKVAGGKNDDPLIETGEPVRNDEAAALGSVTWVGARTRTTFSGRIKRVDYTQDSRFFDEDQRDYWRYGGGIEVLRARGTDTGGFLDLYGDAIDYDVQERYADSVGGHAGIGVRNLIGARSRFDVAGGIDCRRYDAALGRDTQTIARPWGDASLKWSWEDGSAVSLGLYSGIQDVVLGCGSWMYGGNLDGRLRVRVNAFVRGQVGYAHIIGDDRVPGGVDDVKNVWYGEVGAAYFLREGLAVRVLAGYTTTESTFSADYHRFHANTEIAVVF